MRHPTHRPTCSETSLNGMWERLNLELGLEASTAAGGLSLQCVKLQMWGCRRAWPESIRASTYPETLQICKNQVGRPNLSNNRLGESMENNALKNKADKHVVPFSVEALGS